MTTSLLCLISFAGGMAVCWAYASFKIRKAEADALDLLCARHAVELSLEDSMRRAGV